MPLYLPISVALLGGGLTTAGFHDTAFAPILLLLGLGGLLWLNQHPAPKQRFWLGGLWGLAHFLSGLYWVYISTAVYGGAPWWLGVLLLLALCSYSALYPALFCRFNPSPWLAPVTWTALELLRAHLLWGGFPWLSLGYAQLSPVVSVLGVHGQSLLLMLLAVGAYQAIHQAAPHRSHWQRGGLVSAVLAVVYGLKTFTAPPLWTAPHGQPLRVALLQGNIKMDEKWQPQMGPVILERYQQLTQAAIEQGHDLVLWSEVVPNYPYQRLDAPYFQPLSQQALQRNTAVLVGSLAFVGDSPQYTNSLIGLGTLQGRYDKRHLVPFGEFFPIPAWLRPIMDVLGTPYADFVAGNTSATEFVVRDQRLGVSICFEDVFGHEFATQAPAANVLVNATNDAWFAGSSQLGQHLRIAQARALETGRPVVRATNTGITALIAANGTVLERLPADQIGTLSVSVQGRQGSTPYVRWGDWGVLALLLMGLLIWLATFAVLKKINAKKS
jgi:apolipoprotein N-acyltransferase